MPPAMSAEAAFRARFDPAATAPGAYAEPDDIVLFVHIPKTAGVSLGASLQSAFDRFHGVKIAREGRSFDAMAARALRIRSERPCRQVIAGHFDWGRIEAWRAMGRPAKAISVVRSPLERLVSHYNYNSSARHPDREAFRRKFPTLLDFAKTRPADPQLRQLIGPFETFEEALEKLAAHYTFLGVTERLDKSLAHLALSHGLPPMTQERRNAARRAVAAETIPAEVREVVTGRSVNDRRLHALLLACYDAWAPPQKRGPGARLARLLRGAVAGGRSGRAASGSRERG